MIITGVGSRNLPSRIEKTIIKYGNRYAVDNLLRTGDAIGSDNAFVRAWDSHDKRIFVSEPYKVKSEYHVLGNDKQFDEAKKLVESLRPHVRDLDEYSRRLHYRNAFQVLGVDLDSPSDVLLCYAEPVNSKHVKGGTNTAVQIAKRFNIPVYNLYYEEDIEKFINMRILGLCF